MRDTAFPLTPWSSIVRGAGGDAEARNESLKELLASYWLPIYATVRCGFESEPDEARDRVQEFFYELLRGDLLKGLDPETGRFREVLKAKLSEFMGRVGQEADRPAPQETSVADLATAEPMDVRPGAPEAVFDEAWLELLFERALERLDAEKDAETEAGSLRIFHRVDVVPSSGDPARIADELGLEEEEVRTRLLEGRKRFRRAVAILIQEYAVDDRDAREELRWTVG